MKSLLFSGEIILDNNFMEMENAPSLKPESKEIY